MPIAVYGSALVSDFQYKILHRKVVLVTSFLAALAALIIGYAIYGKIVDSVFGPTDRETPAGRSMTSAWYSCCFI